jgi:hypothetical protein
MRSNVWASGIAVLLLLANVPASRAEIIYPWCAQYGTRGGARNCGFSTYEQCRAALSGNGGYCIENPFWQRPPEPSGRGQSRRAPGTGYLSGPEGLAAKPKRSVSLVVARTEPHVEWCHLKGRRGDPKLFLSQQASGCFD